MPPIRFGNVVCLFKMDKEKAKMLADPMSRILQHRKNGDVYAVIGQEDVQTVDFLLRNRDQFLKSNDNAMGTRLNYTLVKFLKEKANVTIADLDAYAAETMEMV